MRGAFRFPGRDVVWGWFGLLVLGMALGCVRPQPNARPERPGLARELVLTIRFGVGTIEEEGRIRIHSYLSQSFRRNELRSLPEDRAWLCTGTIQHRRFFVHLMRFREVRFFLTAGQYRVDGGRMVIPGELKVHLEKDAFYRETDPITAHWLEGRAWSEVVVSLVPPRRVGLLARDARTMDCAVESLETILQRFQSGTR